MKELPRGEFRYRLFCRVFAVGAFFHLALPDARHLEWLIPNLLLGGGALVLLVRAPDTGWLRSIAWGGCAAGTLIPLVALGDQLTQSVILALHALAMLARAEAAIRQTTLAVYGVAAFHKLNADFLDPAVSCASAGMELLADNWSLPFLAPDVLANVWPPLFLCTEAAVALLLWRRPAIGVLLALAMHIPLTIVFAPAFAWVMIPGWVYFFRSEELERAAARIRWRRVVLGGSVPAAISMALYFRDHWVPYPFWQLNEFLLWIFLAACISVVAGERTLLRSRGAWIEESSWRARVFPAVIALVALTPYLGLQFHHAGAMLSNLRIDQGCWNHLLMPEALRLQDPYLRIDAIELADLEAREEAIERLWTPRQLREALDEWCEVGAVPMRLEGRRLSNACGETFDSPRGLFQTNLQRTCPQRCIH
ncbi:MAG: hypothetical protein AAGE52_17515 [Myxococcota bacterium]